MRLRDLIILLPALLIPAGASATLGRSGDSISVDAQQLSAKVGAIQATTHYTTREIDTPGCKIREFVAPNGQIFGVAWKGQHHPNLAPLLGDYIGEFQKALSDDQKADRADKIRRGRHPMRVKSAHVVVEKGGHMRSIEGRAYLPMNLPDGVSLDEIRY